MSLNWRDIQDRAITLSHNYRDAKDEDRDCKPFWKDIFSLYGVEPREIGSFEERVRIHGRPGVGKIDYLAPGRFLIEQKSRGFDLDDAFLQAMTYFGSLKQEDQPRYIVVSDFEYFRIYDLEDEGRKRRVEFQLKDFSKNVKKLSFLADQETVEYVSEEEINVKAVRAIGKLHRALKESHYPQEYLSQLLTRLVFLFFADDTGIFDRSSVRRYLDEKTKEDGSDIGAHLLTIFQVLDTKEDARQSTTGNTLAALPYVNGGLFKESIRAIFGNRDIRETLMKCMEFDWSRISPAVFGSMFQSVMDEKERHDLGAHYTSEQNILKVINGLFLEDIKDELEKAKSEDKLNALWDKISTITILDPACGCGNFLVIAYRELRRIEIEIIKRLDKGKKGIVGQIDAGQVHLGLETNLSHLSKMSVERMYGIEIESFPAEVAKLSLWLMDHMMNMELGAYYGKPLRKLPLTEAPHIVQGNALRMDWEEVVPKEKLTHILGNPPFLGKHLQTKEQKAEITTLFNGLNGVGSLDYVTGWYKKAADYMQDSSITCAFVSTNSITQGEQVGILWKFLIQEKGTHIYFAHRTFKWSNEATGKAAVYCIIVGFGLVEPVNPHIFVYKDIRGVPEEISVKHINPYLVDALDVFVESRTKALCDVPKMVWGNKPVDGGQLILSSEEKENLIKKEPFAAKYIKRLMGAHEFLQGESRWCLWLVDASPTELQKMPLVLQRIANVRTVRSMSTDAGARRLADRPSEFRDVNNPDSYILIPAHSSENRYYIPMGFLDGSVISHNSCQTIPNATIYHFGVLESEMHMSWMRAVAGRLKSDYRYSKDIVYNNFPWPESPDAEDTARVEVAAQAILDARAQFSDATLADLYNPNTMPKVLLEAHKALDKAVDACYAKNPSDFPSEPMRLTFLFEQYQKLIGKENKKMKPGRKAKK